MNRSAPHKPKILKSTGEEVRFSEQKLRRSLKHSGASSEIINSIVATLLAEMYPGITTREIHNRAFTLLKSHRNAFASRYKLKRALYELGPSGFPFEKFVSALLNHSGYDTKTNEIIQGNCVSHEVDVVARNGGSITLIECKFHSDESRKCNVKIPLYISARYQDIIQYHRTKRPEMEFKPGWVVTNTRFTTDAEVYGKCMGLYLLSWDFPRGTSLKDRIDQHRLYPITVSVLLSGREKDFLLSREIVLCRELLKAPYYLDHLGIGESRKQRILEELRMLCITKNES
ncbi:MAG: hypothetical protein RLZZ241_1114 [Bacteroidota bacterium]